MSDAVWVEIVIPVGAADVDDVAALIASEIPAAGAGTEQRGDEIVFWVREAAAPDVFAEVRDIVTRWQAGGLSVDPARLRIAAAMPEAEWRDAWKRYFRVSRLTRQLVVVPSWERFAPAPDDVVIDLDPGMAFGTGTHASTRLVLEEIQALADRPIAPARILDVGCGSGILAIAAAKLWPRATCLAIDNDPNAIAATCENAAINKVAERIATSTHGLRDPGDAAIAAREARAESAHSAPDTTRASRARSELDTDTAGARGELDTDAAGARSELDTDAAGARDAGDADRAPYELVLANIQAHVLRALKDGLVASTAPGGTLILSGLLTPQAQPLADEFAAAGMTCVRVRASSDDPQWSCAVLVR